MPTRAERIEGGLLGLLVGDAVGVPYEFHPPDTLPPRQDLDVVPPPGFVRAHGHVPVGTYSDDGAQALCLLASLLERGGLDVDDVGRRLVAWYEYGDYAVGHDVFDVGVASAQAIRRLRAGVPAAEAGAKDAQSNGNGSLMRVLPLVFFHRGTDEDLVRDAHAQSAITHAHPRSEVCCALYCLWARRTLDGEPDGWPDAVRALRGIYGEGSVHREEFESHVRPDDEATPRGTGYVVDCLRSARWAFGQGSYEEVIRAAISLGHDTDTTACVAGGVAGLRDGVGAIPEHWRAALRGGEIFGPLLDDLLRRG